MWNRRYQYGAGSNRLAATSLPGDDENVYSASYTHDADGNMTVMPHLAVMEWDAFGRLRKTSAGTSGQSTTFYVYDTQGQRVRKVTEDLNGVRQKERIYFGTHEVYREYDVSDGSVELERQTLHVMDDKSRVALVETRTFGTDSYAVQLVRYQLDDHLGSSCVETNAAGTVISYEEYHPFGGPALQLVPTGVGAKRYRYTGKERDEETGLYYYGARYYSAWLGRWTSADPAGLVDGPNLYAYVRCHPTALVDHSGEQASTPAVSEDQTPKSEPAPVIDPQITKLNQLAERFGPSGKEFIGSLAKWFTQDHGPEIKADEKALRAELTRQKAVQKELNREDLTAKQRRNFETKAGRIAARIANLREAVATLKSPARMAALLSDAVSAVETASKFESSAVRDFALVLGDVVWNEARGESALGKKAIAYAYINLKHGKYLEPTGADISYYQPVEKRWATELKSHMSPQFARDFAASLNVASARLSDPDSTKNDPTGGRTNWYSGNPPYWAIGKSALKIGGHYFVKLP